jgi:glycosyltransferase involved in cell wall biosynthesis
MRRECQRALGTPWEKMDVIFNGVDPKKFNIKFPNHARTEFRSRFAAPNEKIIFFVGRLVREKGVQVLIDAMPKIRWFYNDSKLLIVGGGYRDHLVSQARALGIDHAVYFAGFVPDEDLLKAYHVADVACFPSLYEPFGIVALEAMAAKTPVVVSDAGGLPEVVENGVTGTTTYAGNANSLADGVLSVLHDPRRAHQMAVTAYERVQSVFNWNHIAEQTTETYNRVWEEYLVSDFNPWPIAQEEAG